MKPTNNKKSHRFERGFTLIELLVVIAIITVLSSVILTATQTARRRAEDSKIKSERNQLRTAMEFYYSNNGAYPTPVAGQSYCIGGTYCSVAEAPIPIALSVGLASAGMPAFTYVPSSRYNIDGNVGFVYVMPPVGTATILTATHESGATQQTVGIWTVSAGSN